MDIIFNPIVVAVILLVVLCMLKINVLLSLVLSAMAAGLMSGMTIPNTMSILISGMGVNAETALSYILLGILAAGMAYTGITEILSQKISRIVGKKGILLIVTLAIIACCSQNIIPVHIAFIPILIPSLLPLMNDLKLDRRNIACALSFGLKAPYISLPFGFGLLFQGLISENLTENGMEIDKFDVWHYTWPIGLSMIFGLIFAMIVFHKPRVYKNREIVGSQPIELDENGRPAALKMEYAHWITLIAAIGTLAINLWTKSLPLGALSGIIIMVAGGAIKLCDLEDVVKNGFSIMGVIAFIMLVASGYAAVMNETGEVNNLVHASLSMMGTSKIMAGVVMMIIGLIITIGIGTSFGTIPVLAVLYVPLCIELGFSVGGTVMLIAAAAALGDAGSPASDTTLGPTSGLNADGQHNHIWDTCIPTGLFYNIPIALCAIFVAPLI